MNFYTQQENMVAVRDKVYLKAQERILWLYLPLSDWLDQWNVSWKRSNRQAFSCNHCKLHSCVTHLGQETSKWQKPWWQLLMGLIWGESYRHWPKPSSWVHAYCITYKVKDSKTNSSLIEDTGPQVSNTLSRQSLSCSHGVLRSAIQLLAWAFWAPSAGLG